MAERFLTREFVRWSDVDKAGIIFYGAYLRFFEIAETELFRAVGLGYSRMFDEYDIWLPRRHLQFDFHAPALLDDLLDVEGWVGHIGRTSLRLDFATYKIDGDARVLTADGHVVMVSTDRERLRPVPLPTGIVERLARFYEPSTV